MNKNLASKISTLLLTLAITICMCAASTTVAFAADEQAQIEEYVNEFGPDQFSGQLIDNSAYGSVTNQSDYTQITYTDSNGTTSYWYYLTANASAVINTGKSLSGQAQIAALDDLYTLNADTTGAAGLMSGLEGPLRTFLGILVTCITVGMTLFTAFDICYIAFPVFRGKMDDAKANGAKGITRTNGKGETKLNIVTEDAQFAVVSSETVQTGKNAFVIYFEKRVISFVVLAVLIFILLTGNINILTNIGVKLASGILNAINNSF